GAPAAALRLRVNRASAGRRGRAAFGGTQPRSNGFGNDAVAEQGDGVGGRGGHGPGPPGERDARIQSAPRDAAQGEVVWVPNARPPLIQLQNAHTLPPMLAPDRVWARCQATPSTSRAARSPTLRTSTGSPARVTAIATHSFSRLGEAARKRR